MQYFTDLICNTFVGFMKPKMMGSGLPNVIFLNHVDAKLKEQRMIAQSMPKTPLKSSHLSNRTKNAKWNAKR